MESKSEWMEFYHRSLGLGQASGSQARASLSGRVSDAMAVTTTMTMPDLASPQRSSVVPAGSSAASANSVAANASSHLRAEGRVAKGPRKRTRVSKRAPTTLLNTDTHNFRAMVQQFTGGPSAHLFTGYQGAGSNLNLGYDSHHHQMNNPLGVAATVPLPQPRLQQQEELVFFSSDDGGNMGGAAIAGGSNGGGNQVFLQGLTNSRPNHDGFLFDGASSIMQPKSTTFHRW